MNHVDLMKRAIKLAEHGRGKTSPNPLVGAVLVKKGQIIAEGFHEAVGKPHAEAAALKKAGEKAKNATLYVTLEPCCFWGRTPPCVDAIISARVTKVIAGLIDPNPKVMGQGIKRLRMAGVEVETGLLADEVAAQNEVYVRYVSSGRPFILLKIATSLDGKTATATGESKWISGEKSRRRVHQLRNEYDAVMVGIGTVLKDNPLLTVRAEVKNGRNPVRVIVDSQGRIPFSAQVVATAREIPTIIATTDKAPMKKVKALQELGLSVVVVPSKDRRVDLEKLFQELAKREIASVMVESGPRLNTALVEAGLFDKIVIFYSPKIIGGDDSPGIIGGRGAATMDDVLDLEFERIERVGKDVMVTAYPKPKQKISAT